MDLSPTQRTRDAERYHQLQGAIDHWAMCVESCADENCSCEQCYAARQALYGLATFAGKPDKFQDADNAAAEADFLEQIIQERTAANPAFPAMVDAASRKRSSSSPR